MSAPNAKSLLLSLKRSQRLPSPPGTALRVLDLCRRANVDVREIAEAVQADPTLSGRLLRYANSAMLGGEREVTSVRDAVLSLGVRAVKITALGFSLATHMDIRCPGFSLSRFWTESLLTAILARQAAAKCRAEREEAFTAGLLARIGQLAMAYGIPEQYVRVLEQAASTGQALHDVERERLGTDHAEFGAELLVRWSIPDKLVQAIKNHLQPVEAHGRARELAHAVHVATRLAPMFVPGVGEHESVRCDARAAAEDLLGLNAEAWDQFAQSTLDEYKQAAETFEIELDDATIYDVYAEAQEEAAQLSATDARIPDATGANADATEQTTPDGVGSRATLDARLAKLVDGESTFALLLIEIDHGELIENTYGPGDRATVLTAVIDDLRSGLRDTDLLAEFDGGILAVVAPDLDQRLACTFAARTRKRIENLQITLRKDAVRVTASVGLTLSSVHPTDSTPAQLLDDAVRQLEHAQESGRNTWSYCGRSAAEVARSAAPQSAGAGAG